MAVALNPWTFLPIGYAFSVLIEAPILLVGLSARHSFGRRLFAGFWLTACTYPIVILVLPALIGSPGWLYLLIAETFAPVAECTLFWVAFGVRSEWGKMSMVRDLGVILLANLASFGLGEMFWYVKDSLPM
jgi:hypothetical protein